MYPIFTQRKLKKEPNFRVFVNSTFQLTDDPNDLEYKVLKGEQFPRTLPLNSVTPNWAWVRHFHCNTESFFIPKNAEYRNDEILTAVLNGKYIDTSPKNCVVLAEPKLTTLTKISN